jgi:hypothetical protein
MNDDAAQLVRVPIADATPAEMDGAERLLRAAVARDGSDNDAVFELALILYAKQNLEEALALISKAIDGSRATPGHANHRGARVPAPLHCAVRPGGYAVARSAQTRWRPRRAMVRPPAAPHRGRPQVSIVTGAMAWSPPYLPSGVDRTP